MEPPEVGQTVSVSIEHPQDTALFFKGGISNIINAMADGCYVALSSAAGGCFGYLADAGYTIRVSVQLLPPVPYAPKGDTANG